MRSGLGRLVIATAVVAAGSVWLALGRSGLRPEHKQPTGEPAAIARDYVTSGRNLLAQRRLPEAYAAFREAIRLAPDEADGHRGLAAVAYDQGAVIEAVGHLERVAELDPTDGRPYRMIGHICADLDKREDAVDAFRQALTRVLTPAATAEVREELAGQLLKLGDAEAALEQLPAQADISHDSVAALAVRIEASWTTAGPEAAADLVKQAVANRPNEPRLLSLLGRIEVDLGHYAEAVAPLKQAIALDRTELTTLQALATAHERLGQSDAAQQVREQRADVQALLERLTELNVDADAQPWNAAIREELAAICARLGKQRLAAMWRHAASEARKISSQPIPGG